MSTNHRQLNFGSITNTKNSTRFNDGSTKDKLSIDQLKRRGHQGGSENRKHSADQSTSKISKTGFQHISLQHGKQYIDHPASSKVFNHLSPNGKRPINNSTKLTPGHNDKLQQQQKLNRRRKHCVRKRFSLPETIKRDRRKVADELGCRKLIYKENINENHMETLRNKLVHPLVDIVDTELQNDIKHWKVDTMLEYYIADMEDQFMKANDNIVTGGERMLLLPDDVTQNDKNVILKRRYIRRNGVHVYDKKGFKKLLSLYMSLKNFKIDIYDII